MYTRESARNTGSPKPLVRFHRGETLVREAVRWSIYAILLSVGGWWRHPATDAWLAAEAFDRAGWAPGRHLNSPVALGGGSKWPSRGGAAPPCALPHRANIPQALSVLLRSLLSLPLGRRTRTRDRTAKTSNTTGTSPHDGANPERGNETGSPARFRTFIFPLETPPSGWGIISLEKRPKSNPL